MDGLRRLPLRRPGVRYAAIASVVVVLAALSSCDLLNPPSPPSFSFGITGDSVVPLSGTVLFGYELDIDASGGPVGVRWSSSDSATATVDASGTVRGVAIGSAVIIGKLVAPDLPTELSDSLTVEVVYASIRIDAVDSLTGVGETRLLIARGLDVNDTAVAIVAATFATTRDKSPSSRLFPRAYASNRSFGSAPAR